MDKSFARERLVWSRSHSIWWELEAMDGWVVDLGKVGTSRKALWWCFGDSIVD